MEVTFNNMPEVIGLIFQKLQQLEEHIAKPAKILIEHSLPEILSVKQASTLLKLTTGTIYNLVNKGLIPHSKKGGRVRFNKIELEKWIQEGKRRTIKEECDFAIKAIVDLKKINNE